jgi:NADPH-dependent glutamate synthase beta subunit-like oxidoreductase
VLGGGNTAIDAALSARRAGASDVSIVYRRSFAEMPASPEERDLAIRSGVHLLILTAPLGYAVDGDGKLAGLMAARTRLGAPGPDGRRIPEVVKGSEHTLPADLIVEAIGQKLSPEVADALPGVRLTDKGLVWTGSGSLETSRSGVFAAGDIVNGGTTIVQAVAEGARAAREIDAFFCGASGGVQGSSVRS